MRGPHSLAAATLALLLVFSVFGNSGGAPQGRRFISDHSRRKDLSSRLPAERRSPNLQLLTLPEVAALLLGSLQRPQEDT
uniref:Uncharacterized protein n=1 Tax=Jaculus jaculus TaxID=51337 RepID=A0A8C5P258_JACJA